MGMFDTIYFDKPYLCPMCQEKITSTQTKAFENLLEDYHVKDCLSHGEEIRVVKEELFCDYCSKHTGLTVYIVVNRGILLGIAATLEEAQKLMDDLNLEKMILWYHDLYQRYIEERRERNSYIRFLNDLHEWFSEKLYDHPTDAGGKQFRFFFNLKHLKGTQNPLESIERFMTYQKMMKVLDELWQEGHEILDIYYPEEMRAGEEVWSADVYQDEINERCQLNWTWTIISKKELEIDGEREDGLPEWNIVVEEPFSDKTVYEAIEKWLKERGYLFQIKMISLDQAKGSGMIKKLQKGVEEDKE